MGGRKFSATACGALLLAAWGFLAWTAWSLAVEYYDGYQYLMNARVLLGRAFPFSPKNPLLTSLFALADAAAGPLSLRGFHLVSLAGNAAGVLLAALWIRKVVPRLPLATILAVVSFNRLVLHYAPFSMSDLPAAFLAALGLWVEAALPLESARGKAARAAALALAILGRPAAALIPAAALLVGAWRRKRLGAALLVLACAAALALLGLGAFYASAGKGFAAGLAKHLALLKVQYTGNFITVPAVLWDPPWVYFSYLWLVLTPPGAALLLLGAWRVRTERAARLELTGPALGAAAYLGVMLMIPTREARYLAPLLPLWALLQARGLEWLTAKRPAAAFWVPAVLFAFAASELGHFLQPFYREPAQKALSAEISDWNGAREISFAGEPLPFFPEERVFHLNDDFFYVYHYGAAAFAFHSGLPVAKVFWPVFTKYGWPRPDQADALAPGASLVVLAPGLARTSSLPSQRPPAYGLWRERGRVTVREFGPGR